MQVVVVGLSTVNSRSMLLLVRASAKPGQRPRPGSPGAPHPCPPRLVQVSSTIGRFPWRPRS
eukprot:scaffold280301_cov16-Prasinocladus_malaysianus.AAC.1